MSIQSFEIGTTYAGRVNVETLSATPGYSPQSQFLPYQESVMTASGVSLGRGFPSAKWSWLGVIQPDMFAALRAICPGASASVIIRTLKDDYTTYAYYSGAMTWPALDSYDQLAGRRRTFEITFTKLVSFTP
jgi:hypothetical protein